MKRDALTVMRVVSPNAVSLTISLELKAVSCKRQAANSLRLIAYRLLLYSLLLKTWCNIGPGPDCLDSFCSELKEDLDKEETGNEQHGKNNGQYIKILIDKNLDSGSKHKDKPTHQKKSC